MWNNIKKFFKSLFEKREKILVHKNGKVYEFYDFKKAIACMLDQK